MNSDNVCCWLARSSYASLTGISNYLQRALHEICCSGLLDKLRDISPVFRLDRLEMRRCRWYVAKAVETFVPCLLLWHQAIGACNFEFSSNHISSPYLQILTAAMLGQHAKTCCKHYHICIGIRWSGKVVDRNKLQHNAPYCKPCFEVSN